MFLLCNFPPGRCGALGEAVAAGEAGEGELGVRSRSALLGVVRRAGLSMSVFAGFGSSFFLPNKPKNEPFFFSFSAAFLACRPVPNSGAWLSIPDPGPRREPVARAAPSSFGTAAVGVVFFGRRGDFSLSLSSRSVESPSSILFGIPRTGVRVVAALIGIGMGSSSSLESPKRLLR